jgi:hypothetical protein
MLSAGRVERPDRAPARTPGPLRLLNIAADERPDIDSRRGRHRLLSHIGNSLDFEQRKLIDEMNDLDQR